MVLDPILLQRTLAAKENSKTSLYTEAYAVLSALQANLKSLLQYTKYRINSNRSTSRIVARVHLFKRM